MGTGLFLLLLAPSLLIGWDSARAFYNKFDIKSECTGMFTTRCKKTATGKLSCIKNESLDNPMRYSCKFGEGLLEVEGEAAQGAFDNFNVEGNLDQLGNTIKEADGTLTCKHERSWDTRPYYQCSFEI